VAGAPWFEAAPWLDDAPQQQVITWLITKLKAVEREEHEIPETDICQRAVAITSQRASFFSDSADQSYAAMGFGKTLYIGHQLSRW
jgi:hypothetical protein